MTVSVKLRDLRPDLRIISLELSPNDPLSLVSTSVHDDAAVLLARDDTRVVTSTPVDIPGWLEAQWTSAPAETELRAQVVDLVIALSVFDEACREADVFDGNVYLASEAAVGRLMEVAGFGSGGEPLSEVLTVLQHAELIYRFPVAYKFRGAHAMDRQCRLNGWGRLLAARIATESWGSSRTGQAEAKVKAHVAAHAAQYTEHLAMCLHAADDGKGNEWSSAQNLPVPVLT